MVTPAGACSAGSLFIPLLIPMPAGCAGCEHGPKDPGYGLGFTRSMCARTSKGAPATANAVTLYQGGFSPLQNVRLLPTGPETNPPCGPPRLGAAVQPAFVSSRSKYAATSPIDSGTSMTTSSAAGALLRRRTAAPTTREPEGWGRSIFGSGGSVPGYSLSSYAAESCCARYGGRSRRLASSVVESPDCGVAPELATRCAVGRICSYPTIATTASTSAPMTKVTLSTSWASWSCAALNRAAVSGQLSGQFVYRKVSATT